MASLETQVGALIRHHRERAGLTQVQLAEIVERQVGTISRIERGETAPSFKTLERLAAAFSVEVRDFFGMGPFAARAGRDDPLVEIINLVSAAPPEIQRRAQKLIESLVSEE